MRLMVVTKTYAHRDALIEHFPNANVVGWGNAEDVLDMFRSDPNGVILVPVNVAVQGYRVPADTLILVGPGINDAELEQIRARSARG